MRFSVETKSQCVFVYCLNFLSLLVSSVWTVSTRVNPPNTISAAVAAIILRNLVGGFGGGVLKKVHPDVDVGGVSGCADPILNSCICRGRLTSGCKFSYVVL